MLAQAEPSDLPLVRPAGAALAAARVAYAGVGTAAVFLPLSMDVPQYALGVAVAALVAARAAGAARVHRRSALDAPVLLAAGSAALSLLVAALAGAPAFDVDESTRFRALLAPLVILSALSLPGAGGEPDAPRAAAVRVLAAWCLAAIVASFVGVLQGAASFDLLHAVGLRAAPRLSPVQGSPGQHAATGFFTGYARFGQSLTPPLFLAAALALLAPLPRPRRLLLGGAALLAAVAVVFTTMRSGFAGLAAGAAVLVLLGGPRARRLGAPAAAAALGLALLHPGLRPRLASALAAGANADRETIWAICEAVRADHPLGVGWGNLPVYAARYWAELAPGTKVMNNCHSVPRALLVDGGPLLLAAWVVAGALLVVAFWRARRGADALGRAGAVGALAALAALAPHAPFHDLVRAPQTAFALGLTLGLAAVLAFPRAAPAAAGAR